jgi:hypothetical protein
MLHHVGFLDALSNNTVPSRTGNFQEAPWEGGCFFGHTQKRMRLNIDSEGTSKDLHTSMDDNSMDCPAQYLASNHLLRGLHSERLARLSSQRSLPAVQSSCSGGSNVETWSSEGSTRFALSDIVECRHGPAGRCLQCAGRSVCNVPVVAYSTYCRAFQDVPHFSHPTAEEARSYSVPSRSLVAGEVMFASFAALATILEVSPGERFLDLGSGVGRAVVAWALIFPGCTAAGIEIRAHLHERARTVVAALPDDVGNRVHLHCGDFFLQDWNEANVILVNSTGFGDELMTRVAEKLRYTAPGTRAVLLSQPFTAGSCPGLELVGQAMYRMTWGNATAYTYRRNAGL